ncbi:MAG: cyclic nucleotide-binding domain-containing protein [Spirochaetales bacterium]|nr:cyclic nucleotide-binding domain-containing protein [Spirochaetales bacterium]
MDNTELDDRIEKLAKIPLFSSFAADRDSLEKLNKICNLKDYDENIVVIQEGAKGDDMFIVFAGSVEIRKNTRSGDEYTVVQLSAEHNVFFGELAIVSEGERSATVLTRSKSTFLVITKNDFEKFCEDHPTIGLHITKEILKTVAARLRKTNDDMLTIFDALVNEIKNS